MHTRSLLFRCRPLLLLALGLLRAGPLAAQAADDEDAGAARPAAEAQALLARPLPPPGEARLVQLHQQVQAAQQLAQRGLQVQLARQLMEEGRGHFLWPSWVRAYLNSEFIWGRATVALDACEALITDARLPDGLRASVALRQAYMAAQEGELGVTVNHWGRAQRLLAAYQAAHREAPEPGSAEQFLEVDALQVRAEVERLQGRSAQAVATLREALALAQARVTDVLHERNGLAQHPDVEQARGWLDGTRGMLVYALVRQGRPAEALLLADEQLRRAQRDQSPRVARWLYRRAHALNALQRHAEALTDAEGALRRLGDGQVLASSHTGHLALAERLRALMGLRRWADADAAYQAHLAAVAGDRVGTARARNPALAALLAAQAGRVDEALDQAERSLRYRERLYGREHPLSQEMAGVRGFVRLSRGDADGAQADFERLFAVALDRPSGWLDLEQRGQRGFVLGLVFDAYLRDVLARGAASVQRLDRALQIADRLKLGATQRALLDAAGRLQAATPALRAALEAEQAARQAQEQRTEALQALYAEEDAARKAMAGEAFKALPKAEQRAQRDALERLRQRSAALQQEAQAARAALQQQREQLARGHPAYADLVSPTLPGSAALSASLRPGEALLVVHALEPGTLLWLLRPGQPALLRTLPQGEAELDAQVLAWRAQLDRSARLDERVDAAALDAVAEGALALHAQLLGPWREALQGVRSLLVASGGPLARVPLAALLRAPLQPGQPPSWLVRDMAVTQLPSAASLPALRRQPPTDTPPRALLGFGDPLFAAASAPAPGPVAARGAKARPAAKAPAAPAQALAARPTRAALRWDEQRGLRYGDIPPLPDTRTELLAIAKALGADPARDLRLGAAATRAAVLGTDLSDRRVLAFATHGLLPGELPGLSQPALALAADGEAPPLLELDDVLQLRLRAHWVLLSACNTAAAEARAPAAQEGAAEQAMSGLVRGFFFAGARSVLATHWAVESESAAALSAATFAAPGGRGSGLERAEALRRAQLQLADGRRPAWRHPYFWAGYALFGDPAL